TTAPRRPPNSPATRVASAACAGDARPAARLRPAPMPSTAPATANAAPPITITTVSITSAPSRWPKPMRAAAGSGAAGGRGGGGRSGRGGRRFRLKVLLLFGDGGRGQAFPHGGHEQCREEDGQGDDAARQERPPAEAAGVRLRRPRDGQRGGRPGRRFGGRGWQRVPRRQVGRRVAQVLDRPS